MKPKIAMLSTYPPTQCGIATFAQSLVNGLLGQNVSVDVVRLIDEPTYFPSRAVIRQHLSGQDGSATRAVLNNYDVVVVQHEFGIYGGEDGEEILDLISEVHVPMIFVLHTVLTAPTAHQRFVFERILELADALITMTNSGRANLITHYDVDPTRVHVIPHGSADLRCKSSQRIDGTRPVVLTWGLLSEGKGVEWGIDALAMLGNLNPKPRYIVAGQTHPKVRAKEGEKYREFLLSRAAENEVSEDVEFINSYMESQALKKLIQLADVILLPYDSHDQVTSGVLVEAMVAGKPIVSTRFPHAVELLADGSGYLVDQCDSKGMADALRSLLTDEKQVSQMLINSEEKAESFLWSAVSQGYLELATELWEKNLAQATNFFVS
jgi:glycosyltransferase involved in cell wall biosynthesis